MIQLHNKNHHDFIDFILRTKMATWLGGSDQITKKKKKNILQGCCRGNPELFGRVNQNDLPLFQSFWFGVRTLPENSYPLSSWEL